MMNRCAPSRRGLTLVELMLALTITAFIGAAIASMMATVSQGVGSRRDLRSVMLAAHAAHSRLAANIDSSRAIVDVSDTLLAIWHDDERTGGTIHASELRWVEYRADTRTLRIHRVSFPEAWSDVQCAEADTELAPTDDMAMVLGKYDSSGLLSTVVVASDVGDVAIEVDAVDPLDAKTVTCTLSIPHAGDEHTFRSSHSLRFHERPDQ